MAGSVGTGDPTPIQTFDDGDFNEAHWSSSIVMRKSRGDYSLDGVTTVQMFSI